MIIDWGQAAAVTASIGTLLLFGVTVAQARILRDQVKQGQNAVAEAARAASAAEHAVTEASRARIDARSSNVVASITQPHWPPYLDLTRQVDPYGRPTPLDPLNRNRMDTDQEFFMPRDEKQFLWFASRITLTNEGNSTANVEIGGPITVATALGPEESQKVGTYHRVGTSVGAQRYALPPGQTMYLDWNEGHTIKEWRLAAEEANPPNPLGSCVDGFAVFDDDREGILDNIELELCGRPIEADPGVQGHWRLRPIHLNRLGRRDSRVNHNQ